MTFADHVIQFNRELKFDEALSEGIRVMNPFVENPAAFEASSQFYRKYYNDDEPRKLILGINPGRFGAGVTGIPFTDTQRLRDFCGLEIKGVETRELSSVFVYELIAAYGGVDQFYRDFLISAVSPLGFLISKNNKEVNYNYYDSRELQNQVEPFIIRSLEQQLAFGINQEVCYCLGNNKNYKYLLNLNKRMHYFNEIVPLEHPRFIMQYKLKQKDEYINKFVQLLKG
ncbi:uracil-DNA glycosylase family protein [Mangrovibacterium lignilyticum]|uniref:uracil-DNA glycosylase family protein n=1 Tax=Mangrovibacterium lignilyticum TaxID=2668052 RepID=UPI0013D080ED|nr:uracil-DNA glycosylase family protein [Mangrovibacterium lignilyticum]